MRTCSGVVKYIAEKRAIDLITLQIINVNTATDIQSSLLGNRSRNEETIILHETGFTR